MLGVRSLRHACRTQTLGRCPASARAAPIRAAPLRLPPRWPLPAPQRPFASAAGPGRTPWPRWARRTRNALAVLAVLAVLYETYSPFRHSVLAGVRCTRLMRAVVLSVWDYKQTFKREQALGDDGARAARRARSECHSRSATRLLEALKKNSGIYVKLGQHVAAVQVLPLEWTTAMRPLQDQCYPTPLADVDAMLRQDLGLGIDDLFFDFDPRPIGVASLAQVHRAVDRRTGRPVAVKVQHADLQEFAAVDMATVNVAIDLVKWIFPDFSFSWLGEEMNEMLPIEMDFRCEAGNSQRCREMFEPLKGKTSLHLPEIAWSARRVLVMEYIEGARIDNLAYLKEHQIDRNQVSQELSRIFSQMVYLDGFFHADPHHGNLLIRPRAPHSPSPFNFDIVLLDHGQYFDIPPELRVNYAKFWLSLMAPTSDKTIAERKKYAKLVGNIDDDMYPILESAITGRMGVTDSDKPSSLLDANNMSSQEIERLRAAVVDHEGLILSIFELLRRVPRRLLMILKLSDLQRSLDLSLATTHGDSRIYLIVARYCARAVWLADVARLRDRLHTAGLSISLAGAFLDSFFTYSYYTTVLGTLEWSMDVRARWIKVGLWLRGLSKGGLQGAQQEMAGLAA